MMEKKQRLSFLLPCDLRASSATFTRLFRLEEGNKWGQLPACPPNPTVPPIPDRHASRRTRWENDRLGRLLKLIENAGEYVVHASACPVGVQASACFPRITQYHCAPDGGLTRLIVSKPDTGDQVTTWQYGTTLATAGVARTDLLKVNLPHLALK